MVSLLTGNEPQGVFAGRTFYKKTTDGYLLVYNGEEEETVIMVPLAEKVYALLLGEAEGGFLENGALSLRLPAGGYCFLKAADGQIPSFIKGKKALYAQYNGRLELLRLMEDAETALPSMTGHYTIKGFQWEKVLVPQENATAYTFFARR